jgi:ferredoxin
LAAIAPEPGLTERVRAEHGDAAAEAFASASGAGTVLIKDETICIRCGLCAERCPAGTITMEQFLIREPSYV